jgi:hypothetical protein
LLVHRLFAPLKSIVPQPVVRSIRACCTAVLTPVEFAFRTGHFRSSLASKAVDRHGNPLPWYTYPAIDLVRTKDFTGKRVLEFGAGQSTIWWADKAAEVVSLEADEEWYTYIRQKMPANVSLHLADTDLTKFDQLVANDARFDVIIIDGLDRFIAARKSQHMLNPAGAVILDNAEGYWGKDGTYPIIDLYRSAGYARVDFYGFSPGNICYGCTSVFFRNRCFLFEGDSHPVRFEPYS